MSASHALRPDQGGKTVPEFVEIMANSDLLYPKKIDFAVPANHLLARALAAPPGVEGKAKQG